MEPEGSRLSRIVRDLRSTWPQLAISDILYKILAFVILSPLTAALVRMLVSMSGRTVLADEDLLFFFLRPGGLVESHSPGRNHSGHHRDSSRRL